MRQANRPLRVAMVAPPALPVPPANYGGTELVVAELVDGLLDAGADVTLFASGDSRGGFRRGCEVRSLYARHVWPASPAQLVDHAQWAAGEIRADARFDVVHAHLPHFAALATVVGAPVVQTIHHARDDAGGAFTALYRSAPEPVYVAISARQRALVGPFRRSVVIHHGLEAARYQPGAPDGSTVAFLGRLAMAKGLHHAIDAAARAGLAIDVAGKPHGDDSPEVFARELAPRLKAPHVRYLGEVSHGPKVAMLSRARALLFPIEWEEPFGLVVVEAMLCGCPVIAYPRGAAPELIDEGVTGFLARDEQQMVDLLAGPAHPSRFDRRRCRARAAARFSVDAMVARYLALYEGLAAERARTPRAGKELELHG